MIVVISVPKFLCSFTVIVLLWWIIWDPTVFHSWSVDNVHLRSRVASRSHLLILLNFDLHASNNQILSWNLSICYNLAFSIETIFYTLKVAKDLKHLKRGANLLKDDKKKYIFLQSSRMNQAINFIWKYTGMSRLANKSLYAPTSPSSLKSKEESAPSVFVAVNKLKF